MQIDIISLFPEMFNALQYGVVGRALKNKQLQIRYFNPRDFTHDLYRTVDDRPYGGGPGMVMMAPPLSAAIQKARENQKDSHTIYLSPQGKRLNQASVKLLSQKTHLILLAGRYEGVDERLINKEIDEEWSIGDYVVSGGEFPIMVLIDAITRLIPGVLGHSQSSEQDSFSDGLLDCPHYTRPDVFEGMGVPSVLKNGNHQAIQNWRFKQSLGQTWLKRPDLLARYQLTKTAKTLLNTFIKEYEEKAHEK